MSILVEHRCADGTGDDFEQMHFLIEEFNENQDYYAKVAQYNGKNLRKIYLEEFKDSFILFYSVEDGNIIGFATIFPKFSTRRGVIGFELNSFYIRENYRGQSLSQAAFDIVEGIVQYRGGKFLELEVYDNNYKAIKFWERLGLSRIDNTYCYGIDYE